MITPEIAAFVVKEYLLPMFESDGKRIMNKKTTQQLKKHIKSSHIGGDIDPKSEKEIKNLMEKDYKKIKVTDNENVD